MSTPSRVLSLFCVMSTPGMTFCEARGVWIGNDEHGLEDVFETDDDVEATPRRVDAEVRAEQRRRLAQIAQQQRSSTLRATAATMLDGESTTPIRTGARRRRKARVARVCS